jgi:DNA repair exonuclease SbcCD ATPase subunit
MSDFESVENSGVPSGESQAPETPAPVESQPGREAQASESATDKPTPFHEHPRFKELVTQKNEYAQRMQTFEQQNQQLMQRLSQMEQAFKQQPKAEAQKPSYDQLFQRLHGIDPEFAQAMQDMYQRAQSVDQIQQKLESTLTWQQQQQLEQGHQAANNKLNDLFTQFKVPDSQREFYTSMVEAEAYKNPNAKLSDIDNIFKATHDRFSKFVDGYSREIRQSYVSDKKKDATPATTSGGTPAVNAPKGSVQGIDDVKAAIAKHLRASNQKI